MCRHPAFAPSQVFACSPPSHSHELSRSADVLNDRATVCQRASVLSYSSVAGLTHNQLRSTNSRHAAVAASRHAAVVTTRRRAPRRTRRSWAGWRPHTRRPSQTGRPRPAQTPEQTAAGGPEVACMHRSVQDVGGKRRNKMRGTNQRPAGLTRTCVALRAPTMTAATPGCCSTQRVATHDALTPCLLPTSCSTCEA